MDPIRRAALLDVPATLQGDLTDLVQQVVNERSTPPVKAKAISKYFQANYGYTLDRTDVPRGVSPISHFLREKRIGVAEILLLSRNITTGSGNLT